MEIELPPDLRQHERHPRHERKSGSLIVVIVAAAIFFLATSAFFYWSAVDFEELGPLPPSETQNTEPPQP